MQHHTMHPDVYEFSQLAARIIHRAQAEQRQGIFRCEVCGRVLGADEGKVHERCARLINKTLGMS